MVSQSFAHAPLFPLALHCSFLLRSTSDGLMRHSRCVTLHLAAGCSGERGGRRGRGGRRRRRRRRRVPGGRRPAAGASSSPCARSRLVTLAGEGGARRKETRGASSPHHCYTPPPSGERLPLWRCSTTGEASPSVVLEAAVVNLSELTDRLIDNIDTKELLKWLFTVLVIENKLWNDAKMSANF